MSVVISVTDVDNKLEPVSTYKLYNNYPNPFNPSTKIKYSIPEKSLVNLQIYNAEGKEVASLVNGEQSAGEYEINFDAENLASGVYFYKIRAGNFFQTKKMLLLK
ncbi:MAG: T9SS type A sorting domain-containing protein [Ignavibacteriaceae bacterium]